MGRVMDRLTLLLAQNWMKHFGRRGNFRSRTNSSIALFENNNSPDAGIILFLFFQMIPKFQMYVTIKVKYQDIRNRKRKAIEITNAVANGVIIITIITYQQTIYIQYISSPTIYKNNRSLFLFSSLLYFCAAPLPLY